MRVKLIGPTRKREWDKYPLDTFYRSLETMFSGKSGGIALALPTLAALTPDDVEVKIVDERIESIDFEEEVDLVGITANTSNIARAYEIADKFRARGVPVVLGGIHVTMLPEEAIQHVDSAVIGEAEETWPQLIEDFKKGELKKFYKTSGFVDLKSSPIPRWDLVKNKCYRHFALQTTRGCPYDCDFCSVQIYNGHKLRHKPIGNVVKEIKKLKEIDPNKFIFFADDNLLVSPRYARELFKAMIPLKIEHWWTQASLNRMKDDNLLDLMRRAGCHAVIVGLESVSEKSQEEMNKTKVNKIHEFKETIEKVHSHGIAVFGSFIFGTDADDESIFEKTARFIDETNIAVPLLNILTPIPGTSLWRRLKQEGRIPNQGWDKWTGASLVFQPNSMTPKTLLEKYREMGKKVFNYKAAYKRLNYLFEEGTFLEHRRKGISKFLSKNKILCSLLSLLSFSPKRTSFIIKSLWHPKGSTIYVPLLVLRMHDFFFSKELEQQYEANIKRIESALITQEPTLQKSTALPQNPLKVESS